MKITGIWSALLLCAALVAGCSAKNSAIINGEAVSPEDAAQSYTVLGLQYMQTGDTVNAKAVVQKALEIEPNYGPAFNALGLIFQMEDEMGLAESYYRQAIGADPESAMFHNNYGAFLFAQKRYSEACKELAQATQDPFYNRRANAFQNLGRCYVKTGQNQLATHAFERSLKIGGNQPLALVELADLFLMQKNLAKADAYYRQFTDLINKRRVEHSPRSLWVGIKLARLNGKASTAATYALLLKNLYPDSEEYKQYKDTQQ